MSENRFLKNLYWTLPGDSRRAKTGVGLLMLMALFSNLAMCGRQLWFAYRHPQEFTGEDAVIRTERRFAAMRASLPQRGVVGYLEELGGQEGREAGTSDFILAQYTLAPVLVTHGAAPELVIVNALEESAANQLQTASGLTLVQDFGDGLLLCQRAKQ